jgi:hypothetical protein
VSLEVRSFLGFHDGDFFGGKAVEVVDQFIDLRVGEVGLPLENGAIGELF